MYDDDLKQAATEIQGAIAAGANKAQHHLKIDGFDGPDTIPDELKQAVSMFMESADLVTRLANDILNDRPASAGVFRLGDTHLPNDFTDEQIQALGESLGEHLRSMGIDAEVAEDGTIRGKIPSPKDNPISPEQVQELQDMLANLTEEKNDG